MADAIDVRENSDFERAWYRVELVALGLFVLIVLAGLSGLLGKGPLAKAEAQFPGGGATARYERFVRAQTPTKLDLLTTDALGTPTVSLKLDEAFLASRDVKETSPQPQSMRADRDGVTYVFAVEDRGQGRITLMLTPTKAGSAGGTLTVNGASMPFHQIVYP